jgi:hypothetical protein
MQPGTESSQIICQIDLAKSRFLVAVLVKFRAAVQPGTDSSQIIQQMSLAESQFLAAAPVNYRAARAARYRKFSNHPPDGFGQESVLSGGSCKL